MTPASNLSIAAFLAICVFVFGFIVLGTRRPQVAIGLAIWLGIFSAVVATGWAEAQPMPRVAILFAVVNVVTLAAAFSPLGRWLGEEVSLGWLVAFQAFRLPLELVLHDWVASGTIPQTMTWTGQNWDIVSGIAALLLAPIASRSRPLAWLANLIGLGLLLNVMRVAILSSPLPFAWDVKPPLVLLFHLPYALIVPVCVGGALFGHIVLTRALLRRRED